MYGVYNLTTPGWCYMSDNVHPGLARGASKEVAETELANFRKEYPKVEYELRMHSSDCAGNYLGQCCEGISPEEQY